jgi:hypothetical protein
MKFLTRLAERFINELQEERRHGLHSKSRF